MNNNLDVYISRCWFGLWLRLVDRLLVLSHSHTTLVLLFNECLILLRGRSLDKASSLLLLSVVPEGDSLDSEKQAE